MIGCLIDLSIDVDFSKRIKSLLPSIDYVDIIARDDNPAENLVYELVDIVKSFNKKIVLTSKSLDLIKSVNVDAIRIKNTWSEDINQLDDYIEYCIQKKIKIVLEIHHIGNNFLKSFINWQDDYPNLIIEVFITEFPKKELEIFFKNPFPKSLKNVYFRDLPLCLSSCDNIIPSYHFVPYELTSFGNSYKNSLIGFSQTYFKVPSCRDCNLISYCLGCPRNSCSFMRCVEAIKPLVMDTHCIKYIQSPDFLLEE